MAASQPVNPGNKKPQTSQQGPDTDFDAFFDAAVREAGRSAARTPTTADLEPRALLRYAAGRAGDDDRIAVEPIVARSTWAYERVVALVKSKRSGPPLAQAVARRLLDGDATAQVAVAAAVLEVEGSGPGASGRFEEALRGLEKSSTGRARAACLLGLGRLDEARRELPSDKNDPASALLRRVSGAASKSEDEALLALLDAFPSLLEGR